MTRSLTDVTQQVIGYRFHQPKLLEEALTHKSYVNESKSAGREQNSQDNERLEFLGDAVLSLIISEHLATTCPGSAEGELSKLKARLVSEASLATAARALELGGLLRLGRGEELTQGREKSSLLANALEALIAAVYVDGGLEEARAFTLRVLGEDLEKVQEINGAEAGDHKTQLQEWCQKRFETLPQYVVTRESGPDHQKTFEIQVVIKGEVFGMGAGRTKKEAEQMAARQTLEQIAKVS